MTKDNYQNYLETIYQKLSSQIEYSTENKILQFFKKISKKNFSTNFEILKYIKTNLTKIKNNFHNFITKIKANQKELFFTGMIYGNLKENNLNIIIEKLEKYFPEPDKNDKALAKLNKKTKSNNSKKNSNKKSGTKLMHLLHSHNLIDGSFVYRGILPNNTHITHSRNIVANFYQIGKRDIKENLMMTLIEMIWGNLFKMNINKKDKNKHSIGNLISSSKKIIDNIMVI